MLGLSLNLQQKMCPSAIVIQETSLFPFKGTYLQNVTAEHSQINHPYCKNDPAPFLPPFCSVRHIFSTSWTLLLHLSAWNLWWFLKSTHPASTGRSLRRISTHSHPAYSTCIEMNLHPQFTNTLRTTHASATNVSTSKLQCPNKNAKIDNTLHFRRQDSTTTFQRLNSTNWHQQDIPKCPN